MATHCAQQAMQIRARLHGGTALKFRPGWKLSLFTAVFLPLLLVLGNWQLSRAAEKRGLIDEYMQAIGGLPLDLSQTTDHLSLANFQRVRLRGHFVEEVFLVDNQVRDGQVGYWVVQTLAGVNGERFLINRGFLAAPLRREQMPKVDVPTAEVNLVAVVWPDTGLPPLWAEDPWASNWPLRVQRLNVERMADLVQAWPYEFRLEDGQSGVLAAAPLGTTLDDAKHNGYAATWFGLAVTLLIGYLIAGIKQARIVEQS